MQRLNRTKLIEACLCVIFVSISLSKINCYLVPWIFGAAARGNFRISGATDLRQIA